MNALVTGCAGCIGMHVELRLIECGGEVVGADNLRRSVAETGATRPGSSQCPRVLLAENPASLRQHEYLNGFLDVPETRGQLVFAGSSSVRGLSRLFRIPVAGLRFFGACGPWGRPNTGPPLFDRSNLAGVGAMRTDLQALRAATGFPPATSLAAGLEKDMAKYRGYYGT